MTPEALTSYLHDNIPLSRAMDVSVVAVSASLVTLEAPLAPNMNMHGTVFGGSGATLCLLAAWSAIHVRLLASGFDADLVIQTSSMDYLAPAPGAVQASSSIDEQQWAGFEASLARKGRGRLTVGSRLLIGTTIAGQFSGQFVATIKR